MRTWIEPQISELSIGATAQGQNMSDDYDEIRVDQNGNYWVSFSSGADSKPTVGGTITVH